MQKNWVQIFIYMSNERNWSVYFPLRRRIPMHFRFFLALFVIFSGIVSFITTTFDKFQFQSHVCLKSTD